MKPVKILVIDDEKAVQYFLEKQVVPVLDGTGKFHARVAANVLAIVSRELSTEAQDLAEEWRRLNGLVGSAPQPPAPDALKGALRERTEALCERIRRGDADDGAFRRQVIDHVRRTVLEKLAVTNPKLFEQESGARPLPPLEKGE